MEMKITTTLLIALTLFIIIPTGTPDDLLVAIPLIKWLGIRIYLFTLTIALILIYFKTDLINKKIKGGLKVRKELEKIGL